MYGTYLRLNLHVSATDVEVIQAAQRKLKWPNAWRKGYRNGRRLFYKNMLDYHHDAQKTFKEYRF